jgi:hypothetical protein
MTTKFDRLQELIRRFEESSVRKSGGKTRATIGYAPAYVNCNANLQPEGKLQLLMAYPVWSQSWAIAYYYTTGEPHSGGSIIGTTIEESIAFLESHFKTFGE